MLFNSIVKYISELHFAGELPPSFRVMNPYRDNLQVLEICRDFYSGYYDDHNKRKLILGINPGRFGGGVTGIPFTDPKHLISHCGLNYNGPLLHEVSSVFVYDMIDRFGGVKKFYSQYFIGAVFPLALVRDSKSGKSVNCNYYDSKELLSSLYYFIIQNIRNLIDIGMDTQICFCLGTGENYRFLAGINEKYRFFEKIIPLEHPRFIMQYRQSQKEQFIRKYIENLCAEDHI